MTERLSLETELAALSETMDWPPTPDLATSVLGQLAAPAPRRVGPRPWLRLATATALVLAVAVVVGSLIPAVRDQVSAWLGIGGVELEVVDDDLPPGLAAGLPLGEPTTVAEAEALLGAPLLTPEALGPPDLIFVAEGRRAVSMVWRTGPGLPLAEAGVGAVVTQFGGRVDIPVVSKLAGPEVVVEAVGVGGEPGLWITGGPHPVYYLDADGEVIEDSGRLAGNTLLWEGAGATFRLESALDLDAAVAIAESVG